MIAHPFAQRHAATASSSSFLSASSSASSSSGKSSYGTAAVELTPQSIFEDDDRSHTITPRDRLQTLSSRFSSESLKGNSKPWLKPFQIISSKAQATTPAMRGVDISEPLLSSEDEVEDLRSDINPICTLPPRPKRTPARSEASLPSPPSRSSSRQALHAHRAHQGFVKSPSEMSSERSPTLPLFPQRLVSAFSSTDGSTSVSYGSRSDYTSSSSPSKRQRFDSLSSSNPSSASFPLPPTRKTKPAPILTKRSKSTSSSLTSPFNATLLRPAHAYPKDASDQQKLVTLNVGGGGLQRYTLPVKTLLSQPSKLGTFVREAIAEAEFRADCATEFDERGMSQQWPDALESPIILQPGQRSPREKLLALAAHESRENFKRNSADDQMVFGEMSGIYPSPNHLSPLRVNVAQAELVKSPAGRPKSARATILGFDELPTETGEDDWTADYLPASIPHSLSCIISTRALTVGRESVGPESAPGLSCSSSTSSEDDAPHLVAADYFVDTPARLPKLPSTKLDEMVELFLERDPSRYEAIIHYLRTGHLPRSLDITSTLSFANSRRTSDSSSYSQIELSDLPQHLTALLLHPIISQLQDLREEAAWLGLQGLEEECLSRLSQLNTMLNSGSSAFTDSDQPRTARPAQRAYRARPKAAPRSAVSPSKRPTPVEEMDENWL